MSVVEAQARARQLFTAVEQKKARLQDTNLVAYASPRFPATGPCPLTLYQTLRGHGDKVVKCAWGPNHSVMLCLTDGFMLLWDAVTGYKRAAVRMELSWVLAAAVSPDGRVACSGGLDNVCLVYRLDPTQVVTGATAQLQGHRQYISDCRWVDNARVLTSSGDRTCRLWDASAAKPIRSFDHGWDVLCLDQAGPDTFIAGNADGTIIVWDSRVDGPVQQFLNPLSGDVTCVKMYSTTSGPIGTTKEPIDRELWLLELPSISGASGTISGVNSTSFVAGTDDGILRVYDFRSDCELGCYRYGAGSARSSVDLRRATILAGSILLVAVLPGSRFVYAAYRGTDGVVVWDTARGEVVGHIGAAAKSQVSGVAVAGLSVAVAHWDGAVRVWLV